jgi:hypothetical protein
MRNLEKLAEGKSHLNRFSLTTGKTKSDKIHDLASISLVFPTGH